MAQRTLNAFVVLGGRVDNTFGQIGTALINVGDTIDAVSQKLINFGKDGLQVYRSYEDSMLDAQVALSTIYGRGTKELSGVMKSLDAQATEWAASTIFHTDDVANSIAQAAHAGWDYEKILDGIPAAMKLAQAGGLDLSQSVDFIIKSTNAAQIGFGDLTEFIDEWTYAANSSAGDVEQFGEAMTRMGATMRFAGNKEELLTMLAVLHDAGTVGSDAGTLLRNSMIRLLAPTKKAKDAMAALHITQADIDEAMSEVDGDTAAAVKRLEELGFTAYDNKGDLKDITDIFTDLSLVTKDLSEEERNNIFSSIFPTRTITGALALIDEAERGWKLLGELESGAAEGYGAYAAETMMSGLTGGIETFNSKVERLKQVVGAQLAPQMESITTNAGKLVDVLASGGANNGVSSGLDMLERFSGLIGSAADNLGEMDPAMFDALVAGLGAIAVAGPGLIIAGSGMRFLGYALGTHTGRIAMAAVAIWALSEAWNAWNEAKYKDNFGDMELDTAALEGYLGTIQADFDAATAQVDAYREALNGSVRDYRSASEEFSSRALTDMLGKKQLTDADLQQYRGWGEQMVNSVKLGITESADMSAAFWKALFRGKGETDEDLEGNGIFAGIIDELNAEKDANIAAVEAIGQDLQEAITAAFADGELSQAEYENIKSYFRDLNAKIAEAEREAQNEQDYIKRRTMLDKAQNMSYDSAMAFVNGEVAEQRQAELDWWQDNYNQMRFGLEYRYEQEMAEAQTEAEGRAIWEKYYGTGEYGLPIGLITGADQAYEAKRAGVYSEYDRLIGDIFETLLQESDLSEADKAIGAFVGGIGEGMTPTQARNLLEYSDSVSKDQIGFLRRFYLDEINALYGDIDNAESMAARYRGEGRTEDADAINRRLDKYFLLSGLTANPYETDYQDRISVWNGTGAAPTSTWWSDTWSGFSDSANSVTGMAAAASSAARSVMEGTLGEPVTSSVTFPDAASNAQTARQAIAQQFMTPIIQSVQVQQFGASTGGNSLFSAALPQKAKGGRETEPSIFAEAGIPEWYIPEEHTDNTANLILAAAYNSGFSILDLAERAGARLFAEGGTDGDGGLNWGTLPAHAGAAGSSDGGAESGTGIVVHYSPVIHAEDASGVEAALMADKKRLEKQLDDWWERRKLYESIVSYSG